jgi:uncharacterized protein YdhG (YjbR/CyaY superfamily)
VFATPAAIAVFFGSGPRCASPERLYFAAWKYHIGLYPPISGDAAIEKAVAKYAGPKGNLQFPLDEPMPYDMIKRIVKLRVRQDDEKAAAKRGKRKKKLRGGGV